MAKVSIRKVGLSLLRRMVRRAQRHPTSPCPESHTTYSQPRSSTPVQSLERSHALSNTLLGDFCHPLESTPLCHRCSEPICYNNLAAIIVPCVHWTCAECFERWEEGLETRDAGGEEHAGKEVVEKQQGGRDRTCPTCQGPLHGLWTAEAAALEDEVARLRDNQQLLATSGSRAGSAYGSSSKRPTANSTNASSLKSGGGVESLQLRREVSVKDTGKRETHSSGRDDADSLGFGRWLNVNGHGKDLLQRGDSMASGVTRSATHGSDGSGTLATGDVRRSVRVHTGAVESAVSEEQEEQEEQEERGEREEREEVKKGKGKDKEEDERLDPEDEDQRKKVEEMRRLQQFAAMRYLKEKRAAVESFKRRE